VIERFEPESADNRRHRIILGAKLISVTPFLFHASFLSALFDVQFILHLDLIIITNSRFNFEYYNIANVAVSLVE